MQGQLTQQGYDMATSLGKWLRQRYVEELRLLPPSFSPDAFKAHTTMIGRTIATLRGVLSGLYPDAASSGQPIHVDATAERFEYMYGKNVTCAR